MSKKEVKSSEDRINELTSQLEEVASKRDELVGEAIRLNQLILKLQGAIEVLQIIEDEKEEKEEKKSD